jgi:hypothetical protein
VTGQDTDHHLARLRVDGVRLRQRFVAVAASIACTEDQVAETLERMALIFPEDAARLRAHAAQARQHATLERDRATMFSRPR